MKALLWESTIFEWENVGKHHVVAWIYIMGNVYITMAIQWLEGSDERTVWVIQKLPRYFLLNGEPFGPT